MRRRFFVDKFEEQRAVMAGEAAHHLGRVLRAQPGQIYELSDGTSVWLGRIDVVERERVEFSLTERIAAHALPLDVTLLLSIVKFESFEWALEKATELGVSRIVPLAAARSEKALVAAATKRAARWRKILLESAQQSRRVSLPILEDARNSEAGFREYGEGARVLLSEDPGARALREVLTVSRTSKAVLAIGPEGGWTEDEFVAARRAGFSEASLGKLILRTETAVIASLAVLNFGLAE
jgi:16S rRNA (uracil1498-N3)-methyltransferase